jgi:integrase
MGIRKRGDKWLVTAESGRDELGVRRRVCRSVDSEEEAKRLDVKLQSDVYEGRHVKPSHELVPDFCQRYLDSRDKLAPATRTRYEGFLKHVRRDLSQVTLARFTPKVAASWKKKQLDSGDLSSSTVRKHLIFVGAAMNLAVAWKLIGENPLEHVELPSEEPPPFHVYTPSEQAALLSAASPGTGDPKGNHKGRSDGALFVPVALDLATGLRRGELLGLRVADIDLARSRIHVRQALRKEDGRSVIGPCKTKRSRRTVVLPESLADLLAEYASKRPRTRSKIFFLSLTGAPYTLDGFESSWGRVRERAATILVRDAEQLQDPFAEHAGDELAVARFHDLRHTHATELLRAGVHIKVVAERLGDTEATVMRTYSHVLPDMQESAAAAIEPMMRGLLLAPAQTISEEPES